MLIASNLPGHNHERLECARCATILSGCRCAGSHTVRTIHSCNLCLPLTDYDAKVLQRKNKRARS